MNSFLFNVGLILLCSISVIQFCATTFGYYAQATAAQEIFGHTLESLRGIKYLYKYNLFQYAFVILAGVAFVYYAAFGWKKRKPSGRLVLSNSKCWMQVVLFTKCHANPCIWIGSKFGVSGDFIFVGRCRECCRLH
ncbi:LIMR family protein [Acorus gramineus]|uniref:LIMR family protein n=1 Tax=Acorus gramineus TaxID=55184 RepID=A0AAV9AP69_ACOGR|nr:LIMR family protein [Acorus gramineus]